MKHVIYDVVMFVVVAAVAFVAGVFFGMEFELQRMDEALATQKTPCEQLAEVAKKCDYPQSVVPWWASFGEGQMEELAKDAHRSGISDVDGTLPSPKSEDVAVTFNSDGTKIVSVKVDWRGGGVSDVRCDFSAEETAEIVRKAVARIGN